MDAEEFFSRWSRRKAQTQQQPHDKSGADASEQSAPGDTAEALPPPTLDDVAALTPQSDFSRFVARGVDENVRRSALKKLFADPHFNVMDGLDIYIDDYNKFTPLPAAVLAALNHAQDLLNPPTLRTPPAGNAHEEGDGEIVSGTADASPADDAADSNGDDTTPREISPDKPDHDNPIQNM